MVEQPTQAMGEKAVELLLKRINGETQDGPMELALGTSLHRGNSIKTL